ncbi:class I SAM-dependent methyltransferase [Agrilutibacter solisilvae]|uniref:Class I SAM-dependent methyltransferase n=1 Tax=Agrilutibacter solisilvae TaxID=2763317 RepID=A0A974XYQ7_9GAMM|nr:class I SAM-dependent methyltransferase [Lysobacter solisilvae]QSX77310.1 class I SAM-dependent methyltransferase [Lysobacter solisilvae]
MTEFGTSPNRVALWTAFLRERQVRSMAEVGVYRGKFAAHLLANLPELSRYVMIDPWRNIPEWNKPLNKDDATFERVYQDCLAATDFAADRRQVLRGRTTEVVSQIPDGSLDFAYIDGDHTLRGITIDLVAMYPKVREGGWIAGDDFCRSIWQHNASFEPTLVFPLAVHFAEALGLTIHALPHEQFLIHKQPGTFRFVDTVGGYEDACLKSQFIDACGPGPRDGGPRDGGPRDVSHGETASV